MGRGALIRVAAAVALGLGGAAATGCGRGEQARPAPVPAAGPRDLTARPAGPDDVIVARVDGRPVWGSCVAAQAAGRRVDRRAALADCVELELLAGAALARGGAADPDVAAAGRQAGAVRLIDREFRARYQRPGDLPAEVVEADLTQYAWRLDRPESRASYVVRIKVDPAAPRGGPDDLAAEQVLQRAYAQLAARGDLFPPDLDAAAAAAAREVAPQLQPAGAPAAPVADLEGFLPYYRKALFAIPEIGRVAPPVRGPEGWDLILWTDVRRPGAMTREQLAAERFEPLRQRFFGLWVERLMRTHDVAVADEPSLRRVWGEPAGPPGPAGPR